MKKLIQPMVAISFILTASGVVPGIPWYMPLIGLFALFATYAVGVKVLGEEEKDWDRMMEKLRMDSEISASFLATKANELTALEAKVSKAISDLRSERRQGPLE